MIVKKEKTKIVHDVFEKMICDNCGWESDTEFWDGFNGEDCKIEIKNMTQCAYDGCWRKTTEYHLCPNCFGFLEQLIKDNNLKKPIERKSDLGIVLREESLRIFNDVVYRLKTFQNVDIKILTVDQEQAVIAEIYTNLMRLLEVEK